MTLSSSSIHRSIVVVLIVAAAGCSGGKGGGGNCDLSSATPVEHTTLSGSETWASGIHHVASSLSVPSGATLTIQACSRVDLDADVDLGVGGTLIARGTASSPITFQATTAGTNWGSVHLTPGGTADLAYVTLTEAGGSTPVATSNYLGAAIYAQGTGTPPPAVLEVSHVTIENASGVGLALVNAAFVPGSTALTITGSGDAAAYLGADVLTDLPAGTYTGNAKDRIALQTAFFAGQANDRKITSNVTIHDRGVPYCVGLASEGEIRVGNPAGPAPLVTIEAGVTIGFTRGLNGAGRFRVDGDTTSAGTPAEGAVAAEGTAAAPIVFDSCEPVPAAGDWVGLSFTGVDSRTVLDHVQILHAGADSGALGVCQTNPGGATSPFDGDAALQIFFSDGTPSASFLSNSTISQSAGNGIYRAWSVADVDFLGNNSVSGVTWCTQTVVPDGLNACNSTCPNG